MADDGGQTYTVQPNDCISSIAERHGFFWQTLWFHPKNADLRKARKDPNVLMENDQVYIPAKTIKKEPRPTDKQHSFVLKGVPAKFRLRVLKDSEPRKNEPYELKIDGTDKAIRGQTDGDGLIDIFIPPSCERGQLIVGEGVGQQTFELAFGALNPADDPGGALQRLKNMGYDCGLDDQEDFSGALRSFQHDNGLSATGELDAATRDKLVEAHGG